MCFWSYQSESHQSETTTLTYGQRERVSSKALCVGAYLSQDEDYQDCSQEQKPSASSEIAIVSLEGDCAVTFLLWGRAVDPLL